MPPSPSRGEGKGEGEGQNSELSAKSSQLEYMIVAGERRYRDSLLAGLTHLPVRVIEADDRLVEELAPLEAEHLRKAGDPYPERKAICLKCAGMWC